MFNGDEEEELELLRQYEDKNIADDESMHSSDEMDSDLEDKIMSMIQYGSGISKKKTTPQAKEQTPTEEPDVVYAPTDDKDKKENTDFSPANELQIDGNDSDGPALTKSDSSDSDSEEEEDIGVPELPADGIQEEKATVAEPLVTRFINLDDDGKHYMDEEDTSDEEAELGLKLQELIDDQVYQNQSKKRFLAKRNIRVCHICNQPGHERKDCSLCRECGAPKHKEDRCTGMWYCNKCKFRGHTVANCPNAKCIYSCQICDSDHHRREVCPSLLHNYTGEVPAKKNPIPYCYNCSDRGHYGDECPILPPYLRTTPSAFSQLCLTSGSRYDYRKMGRSNNNNYNGVGSHSNSHHRWSDSSRESSPRPNRGNQRNNNHGSQHSSSKRGRFVEDDSDTDDSRYRRKPAKNNKRSRDNTDDEYDNSNKKNKGKGQGKLDNFFSEPKRVRFNNSGNNNSGNNNSGYSNSGNSNWRAINNNTLPQPNRSGSIRVNDSGNNRPHQNNRSHQNNRPNNQNNRPNNQNNRLNNQNNRLNNQNNRPNNQNNRPNNQNNRPNNQNNRPNNQQQTSYFSVVSRGQPGYDGDFPRGNNLPRPSSSGVIDIDRSGGEYSNRVPRYHGGYNRRR